MSNPACFGAAQELDDLQGLSQAEQARENRTAAAARAMRYPVRLSAYSYELLTTFLQAHRLALPLGLLNEHVSLQVYTARRLIRHPACLGPLHQRCLPFSLAAHPADHVLH